MRRPFNQLSDRAKLWRFREVATLGLRNYPVRDASLRLLRRAEKATFRVDVPAGGSCGGEGTVFANGCRRYVFCVYDPYYFTERELHSELLLLSSIRRETALSVPEPIPDLNGALISKVRTDHDCDTWLCALFTWLEGRTIHSQLTRLNMQRVGRYMASLHQYSLAFIPPAEFHRHRFDGSNIFGARMVNNLTRISSQLTPSDFARLTDVLERVRQVFKSASVDTRYFGLIHGDCHPGNFVFHIDEIGALDFDDCGWGYYLYDIAVLMSYLEEQHNSLDLKAGLLEGYGSLRPLGPETDWLLTTFIAAHRLRQTAHLIRESHQPWLRDSASLVKQGKVDLGLYLKK
jgi:Ser/Thr protein kinase RdoA (MazF antagonist)